MKDTSSITDKKAIITKYKDNDFICAVIKATYNPFKKYHVSADNIRKNKLLKREYNGTLFDLLDELSSRQYTGHDAIGFVLGYIDKNSQYCDIILSIFDRNLQIRADDKVINKIIPGLIPTFEIALAAKYEPKLCDFQNEQWYASRKIDGCVSGGTILEFEDGKKLSIKEIVEKKISGNIKSYNPTTKKIEFKPILEHMKNLDDITEKTKQWYKIELNDGKIIKLTGNHRVFLPELKCYRRVDELTGNEKLLINC